MVSGYGWGLRFRNNDRENSGKIAEKTHGSGGPQARSPSPVDQWGWVARQPTPSTIDLAGGPPFRCSWDLFWLLVSFPSRAKSFSFLAPASQIIQFSHASDPDRRVFSCSRAAPAHAACSKNWSVQISLTKSQLRLALFSLALLSSA
jgi:hypothetical protein